MEAEDVRMSQCHPWMYVYTMERLECLLIKVHCSNLTFILQGQQAYPQLLNVLLGGEKYEHFKQF